MEFDCFFYGIKWEFTPMWTIVQMANLVRWFTYGTMAISMAMLLYQRVLPVRRNKWQDIETKWSYWWYTCICSPWTWKEKIHNPDEVVDLFFFGSQALQAFHLADPQFRMHKAFYTTIFDGHTPCFDGMQRLSRYNHQSMIIFDA